MLVRFQLRAGRGLLAAACWCVPREELLASLGDVCGIAGIVLIVPRRREIVESIY